MEQLDLDGFQCAPRNLLSRVMSFNQASEGFKLQYAHRNGSLYQGNSVDWLKSLDDASVDLVFADPPYNIKKSRLGQF